MYKRKKNVGSRGFYVEKLWTYTVFLFSCIVKKYLGQSSFSSISFSVVFLLYYLKVCLDFRFAFIEGTVISFWDRNIQEKEREYLCVYPIQRIHKHTHYIYYFPFPPFNFFLSLLASTSNSFLNERNIYAVPFMFTN